jgi:hypothetical protein
MIPGEKEVRKDANICHHNNKVALHFALVTSADKRENVVQGTNMREKGRAGHWHRKQDGEEVHVRWGRN